MGWEDFMGSAWNGVLGTIPMFYCVNCFGRLDCTEGTREVLDATET